MTNKYVSFGAIMKKKSGDGFYLKFEEKLGVKVNGKSPDNLYINMKSPFEKAKKFVEKGFWTEEKAAEENSKIKENVKYVLTTIVAEKFIDIGWIKESKEGSKYIEIDNSVILEAGGRLYNNKYINLEKPHVKLERLVEKGFITEAEAEQRLEKIPFIMYDCTLVFKDN